MKTLITVALLTLVQILYAQTVEVKVNQIEKNASYDITELDKFPYPMYTETFGVNLGITNNDNYTIGIQFDELNIPSDATITEAYVQWSTKRADKSTGPSALMITSEKNGDAAAFSDSNENIRNRVRSEASVSWEPDEWMTDNFGGNACKTPNIAELIQEIVSEPNWDSDHRVTLFFYGTGSRSANNYKSATEHPFELVPPSIRIKYELPIPTETISKIYINELSSNGTDYPDDTDDFGDWIELYNDNDHAVRLGGLYLSDKTDNFTKWQIADPAIIPAKSFMTFWADEDGHKGGRHTNFKLSAEGETVSLSQMLGGSLTLLDSISYPAMPFKSTYGRVTELSDNWKIFGAGTPEAANSDGLDWLAPPVIDVPTGKYTGNLMVNISHPDPTTTIRYSINAALPGPFDPLYAGSIPVSTTSSVRAVAFKPGHQPSEVVTHNYLFNDHGELPVTMITTDPKNLFDDEIGIYTVGVNGELSAFCGDSITANFNQDWERPANITFMEANGDVGFDVNAGIRIAGSCSRKYNLKSLNIYLRTNEYGNKNIDYPIFPERDFSKYKRLKLRNSGQDYRGIMMRDGMNQRIVSNVADIEHQAYRPTVVYINGAYWGIQNYRDIYGSNYFNDLFDVDKSDLELIKNPEFSREVKEGTDQAYQDLFDFINANDISNTSNFETVTTQLDINNFVDYWIIQTYLSNADWPVNNVQLWRNEDSDADGKFRYMLMDTDISSNLSGATSPSGHLADKLSLVLDPNLSGWPNDSKATVFFRKIMENESFQSEFIQRGCTFMELIFEKDRAHAIIDQAAATIEDEIEAHLTRWAADNPTLIDKPDWLDNLGKYKNFYEERPANYIEQLKSNFDLGETYELTLNYDQDTEGDVYLHWNEMAAPFNYTGTYYRDLPLRLTAIPNDGFVFVRWDETGQTEASIEFVGSSDFTLTPIFEVDTTTSISAIENCGYACETIEVFPNPVTSFFSLKTAPSKTITTVEIVASNGQKVSLLSGTSSEDQLMDIDATAYPSGLYLIKVHYRDGTIGLGKLSKL